MSSYHQPACSTTPNLSAEKHLRNIIVCTVNMYSDMTLSGNMAVYRWMHTSTGAAAWYKCQQRRLTTSLFAFQVIFERVYLLF